MLEQLSNFELTYEGKPLDDVCRKAEVDVTSRTGFLWLKKTTVRKEISSDGVLWFYSDTGKFTAGFQAENLYRSFNAKKIKSKTND